MVDGLGRIQRMQERKYNDPKPILLSSIILPFRDNHREHFHVFLSSLFLPLLSKSLCDFQKGNKHVQSLNVYYQTVSEKHYTNFHF